MELHLRSTGSHAIATGDRTVLCATQHKWTHPTLTLTTLEGWKAQLHTEMVYSPTDGHPSKY